MKNFIIKISLILVVFTTTTMSYAQVTGRTFYEDDLITREMRGRGMNTKPLLHVEITSIVDSIDITKIRVNRGTCHAYGDTWRSQRRGTLRYGERLIFVADCGQVLEVSFQSNHGPVTLYFDEAARQAALQEQQRETIQPQNRINEDDPSLYTMEDLAIDAVVSSKDGYANLRLGAGTEFPVTDKIHTGAQLNISHIQGKWAYVIVLDGARPAGWIHLSQITRVN